MERAFKYQLDQEVKLTHSTETGTIIGRAEYNDRPPAYCVRYRNGTGCQVENWWDESAIDETP